MSQLEASSLEVIVGDRYIAGNLSEPVLTFRQTGGTAVSGPVSVDTVLSVLGAVELAAYILRRALEAIEGPE